MKSIFTSILLLGTTLLVSAQCMIEPWTLQKRVEKSTTVVEGKVVDQYGIWDKDRGSIYTINTIEVYKVMKGTVNTLTLKLVTEGGQVGTDMLKVSPSLELKFGEVGIFILEPNTTPFVNLQGMYKPTASVQSFILYDLHKVEAYDLQKTYTDINIQLYSEIRQITGHEIQVIKDFDAEAGNGRIRALAPPVISSFSLDTLTSGTSTELTITGSNFGATRGAGKVGFKDANFGDGRYYYSPTGWSYVSWGNSEIKVTVPTRAGTGKVQVIRNNGESGESASELIIDWAHLNVNFDLNANDTPFFELQHVDNNATGGYSWQMTTEFAANAGAVAAFTRSLNEWKCETQMNWDLGATTTVDTALGDNINIVEFTTYGDSRLGVCRSFYSGCFINNGSDMEWYVRELDISFDRTYNWYYGTSAPASNQFDFESVATHELGHGHQLGHVRNSAKVMHYSIGNGDRKSDLVATDIAAGNYITNKSITNAICNESKMLTGTCPGLPPTAGFTPSTIAECPNTFISFADNTAGDVTNLIWDFGDGATPATAVGEGPHNVSYSTSGAKSVSLIATNINGSDTAKAPITIKPGMLDTPSPFLMEDTVCEGVIRYTIDAIDNAIGYAWTVANGGSIIEDDGNTIRIDWQDTGIYAISVVAEGECLDSDPREEEVFVLAIPSAGFSSFETGLTSAFTNESIYQEASSWDFGDGNMSTDVNPIHKYADKGNYTVKLVATNRCGEDESTRELAIAFGAGIEAIEKGTAVYPNPVRVGGNVYLSKNEYSSFELYNVVGKLVQAGKVNGKTIKLNNTTAGAFVLILKIGDQLEKHKITVVE